jgi:serine/threonine protein phosphatase PrpC
MTNMVSTFLGDHFQSDPEVHPDIRLELLHPGDTLLFSTNGLTHAVPEEILLNILKQESSSQDLCRKLMDCAREHQSKDDATALVARFVDLLATPRRPEAGE